MPSSGLLAERTAQPDTKAEELPAGYGATMAALLPRDPNWMFAYWEITAATRARVRREHGQDIFDKSRQVLRVYTVAAAEQESGKYLDIPVLLEAGSWYVHVQDSGRAYYCEPGLVLPDGEFLGLVKSNQAKLPEGRVSGAMDERWLSVSPDFDKLLQLSGVDYVGKGSGEVAKSLAQRWEMLRSVFSRAASWGTRSVSSSAFSKSPAPAFRLGADCELILYGATEPGAFLTVSGRKVKLNPDGTFSMRFALPDGNTELPVQAMSKEETEVRQVRIRIERSTARDAEESRS